MNKGGEIRIERMQKLSEKIRDLYALIWKGHEFLNRAISQIKPSFRTLIFETSKSFILANLV